MYLKILGSIAIGLLVLTGCQKGDKQQEGAEQQEGTEQQEGMEQQQSPDMQEGQMPEEMEEGEEIEVSEEEIDKFAEAAQRVQTINQDVQQKMNEKVEDEGMDPDRFNEIQQSQQTQQEGENPASDEEMEQFRNIMEELQNVQSDAEGDMVEAIEKAGLTMERYQQIAEAAQRDPDLMQKLQEKLQGSMEQ
ncbi:MAG: DUF4168 domain-containing protein [Bacteroidales bacterium]